jgi:hypothetical protein
MNNYTIFVAPNRNGYTLMPSGYHRWTCMFCGNENPGGDTPGVETCGLCNVQSNIISYSRQEWAIRTDEDGQI